MNVKIDRKKDLVRIDKKISIRTAYTSSADEILRFHFGMGEKRIDRFHDELLKIMDKFEKHYPDRKERLESMSDIIRTFWATPHISKGSGSGVEALREMEFVVYSFLIVLNHTFGFGAKKIQKFFDLYNQNNTYYNDTFGEGTVDCNIVDVMYSRTQDINHIEWELHT